jgi:IclR family mhp operon transcriptional activator
MGTDVTVKRAARAQPARARAKAGKWQSMRGALRTLTVLRALNVRNGATVAELAAATGISRPALYRLLETLREAGYIAVDLAGTHYCLTMLVRTLAEGFSDEDWVTQVARPALKALQKAILWPVDLGTFMDNAMWIRETTRPASALTIDRGVVGLRFPVLLSATGTAYLAFCPRSERQQILANLLAAREPGYEMIRDRRRLAALLRQVRARGYGIRFGEPPLESGAIAVAIRHGDHVFGCVNMTFPVTTLTPETAARQYLQAMQETASQIAQDAHKLVQARGAAESMSSPSRPPRPRRRNDAGGG